MTPQSFNSKETITVASGLSPLHLGLHEYQHQPGACSTGESCSIVLILSRLGVKTVIEIDTLCQLDAENNVVNRRLSTDRVKQINLDPAVTE